MNIIFIKVQLVLLMFADFKPTIMEARYIIFKIVANEGIQLTEQEIMQEILMAEVRMNTNSKLRFHIFSETEEEGGQHG